MYKPIITLIIVAFSFISTTTLHAKRFALVIGNGQYDTTKAINKSPNLKNAKNDSKLVAKTFRELGFETILIEDGSLQQLYKGLEILKKKGAGASLGVVYYAGHGMEVDGVNYVVPVGARLTSKASARSQTLPLDVILTDLAAARIQAKMVILDCCRNNPFAQGREWEMSRNGNGGLAVINRIPPSTLIMYSAGPGQTASDGKGVNSPFTEVFAKVVNKPNISCFEAFFQVADHVKKKTYSRQQPWVKFDGAADAFRKFTFKGTAPTTVDANTGVVQVSKQDFDNMKEEIERLKKESASLKASGHKPVDKPTSATPSSTKTALQKAEESLSIFLRGWAQNQGSNSAQAWASDFAAKPEYCYWKGDGPAPHSYIIKDRQDLITKYSQRQYELLGKATAEWFDNYNRAILVISYHYDYKGKKPASGNSYITLGMQKINSQWKIISYAESVRKNAFKHQQIARIEAITKESLELFLGNWLKHTRSNSADAWVNDFSSSVNYIYKKDGPASHAYLRKGRAELIRKFPTRKYTLVSANYKIHNPSSAQVVAVYDYDYGKAKGRSTTTLDLTLLHKQILISGYKESIQKK